jgi:hypothetical protein
MAEEPASRTLGSQQRMGPALLRKAGYPPFANRGEASRNRVHFGGRPPEKSNRLKMKLCTGST